MSDTARTIRVMLAALGLILSMDSMAAAASREKPSRDARAIPGDAGIAVGAVFTMSNAAEGNEILVFHRAPDGSLAQGDTFPTGGMGTGGGLGNQAGLVLDAHGRLIAVNAGSNEISAFKVLRSTLVLTDIVPSGGERPISVTVSGDLLYVLNAAGAGSITGFEIDGDGKLTPRAGSTRGLSGAALTDPAQIQFSPDGRFLVVTEKATNLIDVYALDAGGLPGDPMAQPSSGATPFGFDFTRRGTLIVSEAFGGAMDASAVSSYELAADGMLEVISPSVPTTETAACWIAITPGGRFAYTTNTGSGTVSGYRIDPRTGALALLDADGVTAETGAGSGPIDMALSRDGRFLYVLNSGTHEIIGFEVNPANGALTPLAVAVAVPEGANGLAAR